MPWKGEKDPYRIWISEVILQQTRVEQGWQYYERFIQRFPDAFTLAEAPIDEVLKLWQGLGYYSRARNLHKGAIQLVEQYEGIMPQELTQIRSLSSIGPYTAAAIASFAFNRPHAVLDGNVIRVLARVFGIFDPYDTSSGQKLFQDLADKLLDLNNAGIYNQAIMDLGATICLPALPKCPACPFNKTCFAFLENKISELPVRSKSIKKRIRHFNYLVFKKGEHVLMFQRKSKDIYEGMYEFYLFETEKEISDVEIQNQIKALSGQNHNFKKTEIIKPHILTHQRLHITFYEIELGENKDFETAGKWINEDDLGRLPVPKYIHDYLER